METRELGSSGLAVSPIGLGLAAIGRPAYITTGRERDLGDDRSVAAMEARSHEILDAARAAGIRYLDAARSYGYAEAFLASWLTSRGVPPDEVTVGSKWGYRYVGEWRLDAPVHEVKDHGLEMLREQVAESRALLGPWLRLYQIHSATIESGVLRDPAVLAELLRLFDEGLVIGLTTSGPRQADAIREALAVDLDGRNPFRSVQATWNLLERSAEGALAEAHAAGWGVTVKEVLANGRLAAPGDVPAPLESVARRHGVGPDAVAIAGALANPWADVVLSGAATVDQLASNVAGATVRLDERDRAELSALTEPPDRYWAERSARAWA
jgi:aryl-alcohol dehydrogenase-like predicted oxidoreductase